MLFIQAGITIQQSDYLARMVSPEATLTHIDETTIWIGLLVRQNNLTWNG